MPHKRYQYRMDENMIDQNENNKSCESVTVSVNGNAYNLVNTRNLLFLTEDELVRRQAVQTLVKDLKAQNVQVFFMSAEPEAYDTTLGATPFSDHALGELISEMEARFDRIVDAMARRFLDYNTAHPNTQIPLYIVVVDGVDEALTSHFYDAFTEKLWCLSQKCRPSGIHVVAFAKRLEPISSPVYAQFLPPVTI